MTMADHARRGVAVFPVHSAADGRCDCGNPVCSSPAKHPWLSGGFKAATTDLKTVEEWAARWPRCNVGIPTGAINGFWVVDIDGPVGRASLDALVALHGPLPLTPVVATARGWHYYFKQESGISNRAARWPGVDVRGGGGYVLGAGSLHVSGHRYRSLRRPAPPIATAPRWLVDAMTRPEYVAQPYTPVVNDDQVAERWARAALRGEVEILLAASVGQRNHCLNVRALKLGNLIAAGYLRRSDVEAELRAAASAVGLGDRESELTIRSGLTAGLRTPRGPKLQAAYGG